MTHWILDRPPPPLYAKAGNFPGHCDRWAIVQHQPPCYSINFAGCLDVGCGGPDGKRAKSSRIVELVAISVPAPETERTTHYFFAFARAFGQKDPAVEKIFDGMVNVFHEDFVVLEAQQRMMDLKPDAPQINIKVDAASIHARMLLEKMIAAEQGGAPPRTRERATA